MVNVWCIKIHFQLLSQLLSPFRIAFAISQFWYCFEMELKNTRSSKSLPDSNRLSQLHVLLIICCCFCCLTILFCCLITFLFAILNENIFIFKSFELCRVNQFTSAQNQLNWTSMPSFNICVNQARSVSLPAQRSCRVRFTGRREICKASAWSLL